MRLFRFVISTFCLSLLFVSACGAQEGNAEVVLKDVFAKHYLIGGALNDNSLNGKDPNAAAIAAKHFNTITAENVMKWMHIHPEPIRYDFEATDRFVEFGTKHKRYTKLLGWSSRFVSIRSNVQFTWRIPIGSP